MGGAWFQETFGDPDSVSEQRLLERASQAVTSHLGVTAAPIWSCVALLKVGISQDAPVCTVPVCTRGGEDRRGEGRRVSSTRVNSQPILKYEY